MMIKGLVILFGLVLVIHSYYFSRRLLYFLQILQLNGYYPGRYFKWLWKNRTSAFALKEGLPFLAVVTIIFDYPLIRVILLGLIYVELLLSFDPGSKKKPLVFTMRIIRLLVFCALVLGGFYGVLIGASLKLGIVGVNSAIFVLANLTAWLPLLLGLINFIILPIEKIIQWFYVADAHRYLKKLKELESIGITGSFGKTTTKYFLFELLKERFYTLKTPESYNTLMGVTKTIRTKLRPAHEKFIVEMSAKKPGDIKEICNLVKPRIGLVTAIGEQHLETFKFLSRIQHTKGELIRALPKDGLAFLNADDLNSQLLREQAPCQIITFGLKEPADFQIISYELINGITHFVLKVKENNYEFSTDLLGRANLYDLCGAIAVAATLGVSILAMKSVIKQLVSPPHRLELKKIAPEIWFLDDAFNANPVGTTNALEVLSGFHGLRKIIVTPGMIELGEKEASYNCQFGKEIAKVCDYVILVGKKQTKPIQNGLAEMGFEKKNYFIAGSFKEARQHLENLLRPKDVVLFENDLPDTYLED